MYLRVAKLLSRECMLYLLLWLGSRASDGNLCSLPSGYRGVPAGLVLERKRSCTNTDLVGGQIQAPWIESLLVTNWEKLGNVSVRWIVCPSESGT